MQKRRRLEDYALYLLIGGLYAFSVNLSILNTTAVYIEPLPLFLTGLGFILLFGVVFFNLYTFAGSVAVLIIAAAVGYWQREYLADYWYYIDEIMQITRGYLNFSEEFTWHFVLAICFLVVAFIAVCLYVHFHFYMLAGLGAAIFIVAWVMGYYQSLFSFVLYLFCFCVFLIRKLHGSESDGTRAALIAAPLCAVVVWTSTLVPVPSMTIENPTLIRLINEPWEVVSEAIHLAFNPKYFSFQTTGFAGQGGRLGGPVSPNARPIMTVDATRRVYLSGAVHNIYTGDRWTSADRPFAPPVSRVHPSYIEFMETANALFRYASRFEISGAPESFAEFVTYLPMGHIDIFTGQNRTASIFRPMRERGILFERPELHLLMQVNEAGDRRLSELLPRHTFYRYHFLDLDYRREGIRDILKASRRGIYRERMENREPLRFDVWWDGAIFGYVQVEYYEPESVYMITMSFDILGAAHIIYVRDAGELERMLWRDLNDFDSFIDGHTDRGRGEVELFNYFDEDALDLLINMVSTLGHDAFLADYADFVYENYLQLPYDLPQRVIDLAHDITMGYNTDYERIRALQEFLIQFPYTLTPDPVPRGRDFVDYFLFDGQEGYCVYYASAMVVMTRAIGLPARYVEGFLMPAQRDAGGLFTITNSNAHAWAEVYLEGFGWLTVETTAPYVFVMYDRAVTPGMNIFSDDWWTDEEEYLRMMGMWYTMLGVDWEEAGEALAGMLAGDEEGEPEPEEVNLRYAAFASAVIVPVLLALYLGVWHILLVLRLRRIKNLDLNSQAIAYYREILRITRYWRHPMLEDETPYAYGLRLEKDYSFAKDTVFMKELSEIYYQARYGKVPLDEKQAALVRSCYYELSDFVKESGSLKFIFIRYFRGIIAL